jgi:hypothetical protein
MLARYGGQLLIFPEGVGNLGEKRSLVFGGSVRGLIVQSGTDRSARINAHAAMTLFLSNSN